MVKDYGKTPDEVQNEVQKEGAEQWTTDEMQRDFTVLGFSAPFVVVIRKSDGVKGSLEFGHSPRIYFNFVKN